MKELSTLAEVERCCRKIADTSIDQKAYTVGKVEAEMYGPFHLISEYEALTIYGNDYYFITIKQLGNVLTLWRRII